MSEWCRHAVGIAGVGEGRAGWQDPRIFGLDETALGVGATGLWIAATLVFSAVWMLLGPLRLRARADGTVVGYDARTLGDPIVEFVTADGTTVRHVAALYGHPKIGQSVPIRYNPRAAHRARVATPEATYIEPLVMLAIAPFVLSATWTLVQRENSVAPGDRLAVYIPLSASVQELGACARATCSARTMRRRLRSYDRARRAAAPFHSPRAGAQIAALQRSLASARRGDRRPPAGPIEVVDQTVTRELQDLISRGDYRCRRRCER